MIAPVPAPAPAEGAPRPLLDPAALEAAPEAALADALAALRERFGFESFRPGQAEVIGAVLAGRDVLCVLPTGGGKSLCYQLPALLRAGVTLVVSPLIALMKDQVDALARRGIAAVEVNSSLTPEQQDEALERVARGEVRLLYVAPERFRNERFRRRVLALGVSLIAVDEAHCISQWGHDFRPDYRRLGPALEALGRPQVIALTATAPVEVQDDIVAQLSLREPLRLLDGLVRANLGFEVVRPATPEAKDEALLRALAGGGPAIVYCASRKGVERVTALCAARGLPALRYHAGLEDDERARAQDAFLTGGAPLIVATNAFGMGVDRPDVRCVLHYDIPRTVEAYVQESGRAGRDGAPARCVLLHHPADLHIQRFFLDGANPSREVVADVFRVLLDAGERRLELTVEDIAVRLRVEASSSAVGTALGVLDRAALVRRGRRDENLAHVTVHRAESDLFAVTPLPPGLGRLLAALVEDQGVEQRRALNLAHLARRRGVTEETLRRGLQRLHELARITYEPPFRGRATEVRVEGVPEDLLAAVDFDELETKRRREEAKLDQIVAYAHARGCRRAFLLACFGLRGAEACGHCDRCLAERARPARERTTGRRDEQMLRKVVGAVAAHDGRFGFGKLADHLVGSRSAAIAAGPLSRGATYGSMAGHKRATAEQWLHQAHEAGFLALAPHTLPDGRRVHLVQVTAEGRALLKQS
jgi:ATP-dependent DNA helicase RecQ